MGAIKNGHLIASSNLKTGAKCQSAVDRMHEELNKSDKYGKKTGTFAPPPPPPSYGPDAHQDTQITMMTILLVLRLTYTLVLPCGSYSPTPMGKP